MLPLIYPKKTVVWEYIELVWGGGDWWFVVLMGRRAEIDRDSAITQTATTGSTFRISLLLSIKHWMISVESMIMDGTKTWFLPKTHIPNLCPSLLQLFTDVPNTSVKEKQMMPYATYRSISMFTGWFHRVKLTRSTLQSGVIEVHFSTQPAL